MKQIVDKTLHSNPLIQVLKPHFLDTLLTRQIWDQHAAGIVQSCQQTFAQSREAFAFLKDYPAAMDQSSLLQYNALGKILVRGLRSYEQVTGRMMLRFTERGVVAGAAPDDDGDFMAGGADLRHFLGDVVKDVGVEPKAKVAGKRLAT
jgi:hypothetical protein